MEGEEEEDVITAPDAVVRIKIPKSLPDQQLDEEGNPITVEYTEE